MDVKHYRALVELMSTVGSSRDLNDVLHLATAMVARTAGYGAGFFYLWNVHLQRLVLSATTPGWERYIQTVHLSLGEGIVGWSAQHREVVIVEHDTLGDPRFRPVPGLDEECRHGVMAVPVITAGGELVGVFCLRAAGDECFSPSVVDFTHHVATLLAGIIEKARLYNDMEGKLAVLGGVAQLSRALSVHQRAEEVLETVTGITSQVMRTDACAVWVLDGDSLRLQGMSAGLASARLPRRNLPLDEAMGQWLTTEPALTGQQADMPRPLRHTVMQNFDYWAAVSMGAENGSGGFILCLRNRLVFVDEELHLLSTIANQAAVALSRAHLIQRLSAKERTTVFFETLMSGSFRSAAALIDQGRMLGVDLEQEHVVLAAALAPARATRAAPPEEEKVWYDFEKRLQMALPGSLPLQRDGLFRALVPLGGGVDKVVEALQAIKDGLEARFTIQLSIGTGNPCLGVTDYPQGLAEATEALRIGQTLLWDRSRVIDFRDLGIYRYLYKIWVDSDDVRDYQQEILLQLMAYDRSRGTDLLPTLERYLECLGHTGETAAKLYIHRNSLRNRLQKISLLLGIDVTERGHWFPLYLALQIVKLRETARRGGTVALAAPPVGDQPAAQRGAVFLG